MSWGIWELPTKLTVGGTAWKIRTDFRAVLDIQRYFLDPDYEADERWIILLSILYEDFEEMPAELYEEAVTAAWNFICMGEADEDRKRSLKPLMDWEQDAELIIPPVSKALGVTDIRSLEYLHWWTFLSGYAGIDGESMYAHVVNIRSKMWGPHRKKLEKWEQEFYRNNKKIIDIRPRLTEEEKAKKEELKRLLDG